MPLVRIHLYSDPITARRVLQLHQAGRIHHESREAAREEVFRRDRTPIGEPIFVGVTNGRRHMRLLYDVQVHAETVP